MQNSSTFINQTLNNLGSTAEVKTKQQLHSALLSKYKSIRIFHFCLQVMTDCMATLRKFLGTKFGQIPDPVSIRISHWHSNPLTRGSYSYHTTEGEAASITSETLAEPVSNLLFAGEATHEKYFSTVHGAIETGYREADRILNQK